MQLSRVTWRFDDRRAGCRILPGQDRAVRLTFSCHSRGATGGVDRPAVLAENASSGFLSSSISEHRCDPRLDRGFTAGLGTGSVSAAHQIAPRVGAEVARRGAALVAIIRLLVRINDFR